MRVYTVLVADLWISRCDVLVKIEVVQWDLPRSEVMHWDLSRSWRGVEGDPVHAGMAFA